MFEHESHAIAALLAVAAAVAAVAVKLRQPLIVGFIAVGIVVGPIGLGWAGSRTTTRSHCWPSWVPRCCCSWSG